MRLLSLLLLLVACSAPLTGGTRPLPATASASPVASPTPAPPTVAPSPTPAPLSALPVADPYDLSCRLKGLCDLPRVVPSGSFERGARRSFWVFDADSRKAVQVNAILGYVTPHAYFWIEEGISYSEKALAELAETFEQKIYPTTRAFFGSEWTPGVDGDPHLSILFSRALSPSVAGYFSSSDELNPQLHPYSNAQEMFLLNANVLSLSSPYTASTLAHEFQHMIHWNLDRSESTWLNEGLGVLAEAINGYPVQDTAAFLLRPDLNLTGWGASPAQSAAHYMQSYLFLAYLLQRLGPEFIRALVANPLDGLESIDDTLRRPPFAEHALTTDDLFLDWAAALYLNTDADGKRFLSPASQSPRAEAISTCPVNLATRNVQQYGLDYFTITCTGRYRLRFQGEAEQSRFPVPAHSGQFVFWSNEGNLSAARLTRRFDLTRATPPITFTYWTWYDLEADFDYVYLEASTDGRRWEILQTPSGTDRNPMGNAYGWGYNGKSNGWIKESVDLSRFAGQELWLRFEYVTDDAITGAGLLLDDLSLPAVDYFTDLEQDDGGWQAEGFLRVADRVPQPFRLLWILEGEPPTVEEIPLSARNTAEITFTLGEGQRAALLVTALSRQTHLPATYRLDIESLP
ncbi:MAG: hypothetical protein WHS87_11810 [Anaerolineales bacterium]